VKIFIFPIQIILSRNSRYMSIRRRGCIQVHARNEPSHNVLAPAVIKEISEKARIAVFAASYAEKDNPSPCPLPEQNREGGEVPEFGMGSATYASPFQIPDNIRVDAN
jgi:hypothetical protein